jgi:chemotaxis protein MotB
MMTFFLVMWLINSTSSKTITQIAAYFNPVRLTDKVPTKKGLEDAGAGQGPERDANATKTIQPDARNQRPTSHGSKKQQEEAIFNDPYGMLAELAAKADKELQLDVDERRGGEARLVKGEAYRDPFDPAFRLEMRQKDEPPQAAANSAPARSPEPASEPSRKPSQDLSKSAGAKSAIGQPKSEAPAGEMPATVAPDAKVASAAPGKETPARENEAAHEADARAAADASAQLEAAKLDADIKRALERAVPGTIPNIDVTVTDEGVLISLTDDYDFGMFAIASAEPRPATVAIMAKIAKILAPRPEHLIVRGHTDGRPYRNGTYDNWRLSTARAHMAYYMLVRGGIDEKKFERVEGYADRSLRIANDPEAAQNRRIEILLRKAKP